MQLARTFTFILVLGSFVISPFAFSQNNNGYVDDIRELVWRKQYMFPMSDGVHLASDVYIPMFLDTLTLFNTTIDIGNGLTFTVPKLKLAHPGTQYIVYPDEKDPYKLPVIFTRTPYNKGDSADFTGGYAYAILGYCGIWQDMRGRYASQGVYLPMYSDSWTKEPYLAPQKHPLDITPNREANFHEDGYQSLIYIVDSLRRDTDGDNVLDSLICNGKIGMFGASALGNSQFQAAAVKYVPELKCLFPIVASGEFHQCAGHPNGAYREMLINGWLRGQVEFYSRWVDTSLADPFDGIHTIADYGPAINSPREAAETAIDFWTVLGGAHYPYSNFRAVMDMSKAPLDNNDNPDPNGTVSRYKNLDMPIYNLSGWWDIFVDGQIQTWQYTSQHIANNKKYQKLVIGPWAHQTIGSNKTGDVTYPDNVFDVLRIGNISSADPKEFPSIMNSEVVSWFRNWLGTPKFQLPPVKEWQFLGGALGNNYYIQIPADTFTTDYENFFNYLNGTAPLKNIPVRFWGPGLDSNNVTTLDLPQLPISLFGDPNGTVIVPVSDNWDSVPRVRFYVVGPQQDSLVPQNANLGNYWYGTDTFPIANITRQTLYLHKDGTVNTIAPTTDEGISDFLADPRNPVRTHGGGNMIVETPDGDRKSQGQMNLADPKYTAFTMNMPKVNVPGYGEIPQVLIFESGEIIDSFSIIGTTNVTLYAKSVPIEGVSTDSTDADFIVRFVDVYPDGRELYVYEGVVNARAREFARSIVENNGIANDNAPWSNIEVNKIYEFKFATLPIAYTWGHKHKLKILISGTNWPRYQANPNIPLQPNDFFRVRPFEAKSYNYYGTTLYPRRAVHSIAFAPNYPTSVSLPVYGKNFEAQKPSAITSKYQNTTWRIVPNPAKDKIFISTSERNIKAEIYNSLGQKILEAYDKNINIADLTPGIYIVKLYGKQNIFLGVQKLVVK